MTPTVEPSDSYPNDSHAPNDSTSKATKRFPVRRCTHQDVRFPTRPPHPAPPPHPHPAKGDLKVRAHFDAHGLLAGALGAVEKSLCGTSCPSDGWGVNSGPSDGWGVHSDRWGFNEEGGDDRALGGVEKQVGRTHIPVWHEPCVARALCVPSAYSAFSCTT